MRDDYDLHRFLDAQEPIYDEALATLRGGHMCTSYMHFLFPTLDGRAPHERFAIVSLDEARAYLAFPVLGNRYRECVDALSWLAGESAAEVFGADDARRLQASLTLFAEAANEPLLRMMLDIWFDNEADADTAQRLAAAS